MRGMLSRVCVGHIGGGFEKRQHLMVVAPTLELLSQRLDASLRTTLEIQGMRPPTPH